MISCGGGRDRVLAERQDRVAADCEVVTYRRSLTDEDPDSPVEGHGQHGENDGHLPGSSENVELVGQLDIEGAAAGRVADVSAYGDYAYLTVRDPEGCSDAGVSIMDISDPTEPVEVGFIESTEGSFPGEGSQVVNLRTASFRGQVLVFNNELCALGGGGGVSLWDVTDPQNPTVLSAHAGDTDPGGTFSEHNQIHSAFAWQQGRRAFVVIVDNEESTDVDILEVTDPTKPTQIAELDLSTFDIVQPELATRGSFPAVHAPRHGGRAGPRHVDHAALLLGRRLGAAGRRRSRESALHRGQRLLVPGLAAPDRRVPRGERAPGGVQPGRALRDRHGRGLLTVPPRGRRAADHVRGERRRLSRRGVRLDRPDPGLRERRDRRDDRLRRARVPVERARRTAVGAGRLDG